MNVRETLYYVDQYVVIANSPRLKCPVMYYRGDTPPKKAVNRALQTAQMALTGETDQHDDNTYYKLRRLSDG